MTYWNIFWKTFAQLAAAALLAAQSLSWISEDFNASASVTGWALLAATIGAVVAVLWAFASSPATSALQKAVRSAAQVLAGALGGLVIANSTDLVDAEKLLVPTGIAVLLAFLITYFQNQDTVTRTTPA